MDFNPNKTPIQIIKGAFSGTYFRDVHSNINEKCLIIRERIY